MSIPLSSREVLDREYLELRAKILELAASFDRLERADGNVDDDPRLAKLHRAIEILQGDSHERAAEVQQLFSLHYDEQWQDKFDLQPRTTATEIN